MRQNNHSDQPIPALQSGQDSGLDIPSADTYPLSSVQQAIWLDQIAAPAVANYNIGLVTQVDGQFDIPTFKDAVHRVAESNDALRLVLCGGSETGRQRLLPSMTPSIGFVDFSGLPDADRSARQYLRRELDTPIDMHGLVLWDSQIVRVNSTRHYLLRRYHHLITDGFGASLIGDAVIGAYNGLRSKTWVSSGRDQSYLEFIREDQLYLRSQRFEHDRLFWHGYFSESPTPLIRGVLPARKVQKIERAQCVIQRPLFDGVVAAAKAYGFTLAHFMAGLLCVYFSKMTDKSEIVIGYPVHNRSTLNQKRTAGMFSSVIPVRIHVDRDKSFAELLRTVATELRKCYRHQRYPIPEISRALRLSQPGGQRLFDVMLSIEGFGIGRDFDGASQRVIETQRGIGHTPLVVSIRNYHEAEDVIVGLDYNDGLVEHELIDGMRRRLPSFLQVIAANLHCPLKRLPIADPIERQLLQAFNRTSTPRPEPLLVQQMFEKHASRFQHETAVICDHDTLSYSQLNRQANRLANYLRSRDVRPESIVAVCMERSFELIVAILAVLKSGAAYLPLDRSYPPQRLQYMIADSAPRVILTQLSLIGLVSSAAADVIVVDRQSAEIAEHFDANIDTDAMDVQFHHLAYVIYTSGSTGLPKAIAMPHRGIANLIEWHREQDAGSRPQRTAQFAAIGFDVALQEIFATLCTGGSLILVPDEVRRDSQALARFLRTHAIERIFLPYMALHGLAQYLKMSGETIPNLQDVVTAGEQLRITLEIEQFIKSTSGCRLHNHYGPAETHVVTAFTLPEASGEWPALPPIGRPIANARIHILDDQMQPAPIGGTGEIYIGGAGVARGYLNRANLTADRFVSDSFGPDAPTKLYKSGDLGRWLSDGNIEFLGRNDDQFKIRGFRIEPGEIKTQLCAHPKVTDAVVTGRDDLPGGRQIVAYFTFLENDEPTIEDLRDHLRPALPDYMIPSAFVALRAMPVTPNGKLDRSALPAPGSSAVYSRKFEPPVGKNEEILARIWAELLGVQSVGRLDNFFDLGGHSLMIVQIVARLREFGLHADVTAFFSSPSLMALAETLVQRDIRHFTPPRNGIKKERDEITQEMLTLVQLDRTQISEIVRSVDGGARNIQDIYALTPFQEGILFHSLLTEEADPYVVSVIFSVSSAAVLERMLQGLQGVVDRHDLARSAILWKGLPHPVQVVQRSASLPIERIELDPCQDALKQLRAYMEANPRPISVRRPPLMRVLVAQPERPEGYLVLFQFHHLIVDHVSLEIMQDEVLAHLIGNTQALPVPVPFRNFIAEVSAAAAAVDSTNFIRDNFGDIGERAAAFGLPNIYGSGRETKETVVELDEVLATRLRTAVRRLNVSAAALFHAAWALVLSRAGAGDDVVFGTVLSGRLQGTEAADRMFGNCINTLPVRIRLGSRSVRDVVQGTHRELGSLLKYEHAPLVTAQRCGGNDGSTPLFTAVLNYRHSKRHYRSRQARLDPAPQGIKVLAVRERANYPLGLQVDDLGQSFVLTVQTHDLVDSDRVAGYVHTALEETVRLLETGPQTPSRDISVVPMKERDWLLNGLNNTAARYSRDKLVHELIVEQATRNPQATAAVCGGDRLSHEQLDSQSNRLARHLRQSGVGPDIIVGLCVSRSLGFLVAVLGILKAGGAFLPLDPDLPADRLSAMCSDAGAEVVVTEKRYEGQLAGISAQKIRLDADGDEIGRRSAAAMPGTAESANLAYVIFTSGSAGRPKGVAVEHRNVINFLTGINTLVPLPSEARQSWWCSSSFDVSIYEIFSALIEGGEVHIVPDAARLDPRLFIRWLMAGSIESAYVPRQALDALLDIASERERRFHLKRLLVGVEPIREDLLSRLQASLPGVRIINAYGPTEATVCATAYLVPEQARNETTPIGRPLANTRVYVLDDNLEPVPFGVAGELYIGGEGVARGYIGQPELTRTRFVPSPFVPADRLYKTGDRVRYLHDGHLAFLGRFDRQVKVRGHRIELDEISEILRRYPKIDDATVVARVDAGGDTHLVAYFTRTEDLEIGIELRECLMTKLPSYMIPSYFVGLRTLPLTPNGKVDITALPEPDLRTDRGSEAEDPQGPIELAIAQVWRDLLKIEYVGRHENFFCLGGHSLLAVRLLGRLQALDFDLTMEVLFRFPTLASLSQFLKGSWVEASR